MQMQIVQLQKDETGRHLLFNTRKHGKTLPVFLKGAEAVELAEQDLEVHSFLQRALQKYPDREPDLAYNALAIEEMQRLLSH